MFRFEVLFEVGFEPGRVVTVFTLIGPDIHVHEEMLLEDAHVFTQLRAARPGTYQLTVGQLVQRKGAATEVQLHVEDLKQTAE